MFHNLFEVNSCTEGRQIIEPFQSIVKVKLSLSTPLRYVGGVEVQLHSIFILVLDGGEWSTSSMAMVSLVSIVQEVGCTVQPVSLFWR